MTVTRQFFVPGAEYEKEAGLWSVDVLPLSPNSQRNERLRLQGFAITSTPKAAGTPTVAWAGARAPKLGVQPDTTSTDPWAVHVIPPCETVIAQVRGPVAKNVRAVSRAVEVQPSLKLHEYDGLPAQFQAADVARNDPVVPTPRVVGVDALQERLHPDARGAIVNGCTRHEAQ